MASKYPKRNRLKPGQKTLAEQQIEHWREEAAEARAQAERFSSAEAAQSMRDVAAAFERLAQIKDQNPADRGADARRGK
jgi:hypothetical protein